ncbi:MAG: SUMF1/EgtB/PvdO family nonheme iron enzyme [Crocinitomicaceae bacterium]|nr:SUMF1/EgtB/PvdO family nonheme iron enzyme [Crocinitomicaceae bacterium]
MRLPTTHEWMYAATGGLENAVYSWGAPYVRTGNGEMQGNFLVLGDESISQIDSTYQIVSGANTYGIAGKSPGYDVRITSKTSFTKANPMVGFRPCFTHLSE